MHPNHPLASYVPQIREAMADLRYGQFNLLERDTLDIRYNPRLKQVLIKPFFGFEGNTGVCMELMNTLFNRIKRSSSQQGSSPFYVFRAEGSETRFFIDGVNSNHTYLLLAPTRDSYLIETDQSQGTYNRHRVPKSAREKWLVVDPSFKYVETFNESGYQLKLVHDERATLIYSQSRLLRDKWATPLCFNGENELVELLADFDHDDFLRIGFSQKANKGKVSYSLNSGELDAKLREGLPEVRRFVELFRSQNLTQTPYELKAIRDLSAVARRIFPGKSCYIAEE
ncbi:MAG: hypothetical protein WCV90_08470 [Candidatus Woesearchaeota archaeon]